MHPKKYENVECCYSDNQLWRKVSSKNKYEYWFTTLVYSARKLLGREIILEYLNNDVI